MDSCLDKELLGDVAFTPGDPSAAELVVSVCSLGAIVNNCIFQRAIKHKSGTWKGSDK